jgi:hypothetical protein
MAERHVNYAASVVDDSTTEPALRAAPEHAKFQVSLATLIWIMSVLAILAAVFFAFPPEWAAVVALLLSACVPAMLVTCIVYGGPAWRAFAIGALVPSVLRLFAIGPFGVAARADVEAQLRLIREAQGASWFRGGQFDLHSQLIDAWGKTGSAMLADECIFWATSAVAGLASVWVQRMLAGNALRYGGPPRRG